MEIKLNFGFYRLTLTIINQIFILTGLTVVVLGSIQSYRSPTHSLILFSCSFTLASFVMVTALFGMHMVVYRNKCMLYAYLIFLTMTALIFIILFAMSCMMNDDFRKQILEESWSHSSMSEKRHFQKELGCCGFDNVTRTMLYDDHPMCTKCCEKIVKHSDGSATGYSCDCLSCADVMDSHFKICADVVFYFSAPLVFLTLFTMPLVIKYRSMEIPDKSGYLFDDLDDEEEEDDVGSYSNSSQNRDNGGQNSKVDKKSGKK